MTEKRFELTYFDCDYITDHNTHVDYPVVDKKSMFKVVELLNELHEENMNLRAKHTQMIIILKDVVNDLKRMDTYRYAEHLEKIANIHFLSEKELNVDD